MHPDEISTILLEAATFLKEPLREAAGLALKAAFERTTSYVLKRFGSPSPGENALVLATEKPESAGRKSFLSEELRSAGLDSDAEFLKQLRELSTLLPHCASTGRQNVHVARNENQVQVAGRDLVVTARHVRRNVITPDERHVDQAQRDSLRAEIARVAERLGTEIGKPNFAAVHQMLQRRYGIASYLLLPKESFEVAQAYLKQQRAIFRSPWSRNHPHASRNEQYRAIYAGVNELGWTHARLYQFAAEKMGLTLPLSSLKELGPIQLKSLADYVRQAVRRKRETV